MERSCWLFRLISLHLRQSNFERNEIFRIALNPLLKEDADLFMYGVRAFSFMELAIDRACKSDIWLVLLFEED